MNNERNFEHLSAITAKWIKPTKSSDLVDKKGSMADAKDFCKGRSYQPSFELPKPKVKRKPVKDRRLSNEVKAELGVKSLDAMKAFLPSDLDFKPRKKSPAQLRQERKEDAISRRNRR